MDILIILALIAGAGIFLAFIGIVMPPSVRLEKPERGLMGTLQQRLDAAELPVTAGEFVMTSFIGALAIGVVGIFLGAPVLGLAGLIVTPFLLWQRYEAQHDKFLQNYNEALAEVVQLLREGFSATGSLRDALDHATHNGPEPAATDFREVWSAQAAGKNLEDAFAPIMERRHNPYLRMVAEALTLKASEGGSISDVLQGLESMIREQVYLRREISAKQSQARLESMITSLAPAFFFLAMKILPWMREYEGGFYRSFLGQVVLAVAVVFSMISYFLAQKLASRGLTLEVKEVA